jgi:hypothetical protein
MPPVADRNRFATGTRASQSTALRYRAASTAAFIVLAASCGTCGLRANTGVPRSGATTIESSVPA